VATYPPGSGPRANFGQRLVAALIDGIIKLQQRIREQAGRK